MVVHAALARRAGFHIDRAPIAKAEFLTALTAELRQLGSALDRLILPHAQPVPLPIETIASSLERKPGLNRPGPSPAP